jgi:hypothetical protein
MDLVLKHAIGFGQLAHDNKDLAAIGKLSQVGAKGDLLANRKFMCRHLDQAQKPYWMARQIKSKAKQKARASGITMYRADRESLRTNAAMTA